MKLSYIAFAFLITPFLHAEFVWNDKDNSLTRFPEEDPYLELIETVFMHQVRDMVLAHMRDRKPLPEAFSIGFGDACYTLTETPMDPELASFFSSLQD